MIKKDILYTIDILYVYLSVGGTVADVCWTMSHRLALLPLVCGGKGHYILYMSLWQKAEITVCDRNTQNTEVFHCHMYDFLFIFLVLTLLTNLITKSSFISETIIWTVDGWKGKRTVKRALKRAFFWRTLPFNSAWHFTWESGIPSSSATCIPGLQPTRIPPTYSGCLNRTAI